jgi:Mn2+/Fe2+ NRAMP family transporter
VNIKTSAQAGSAAYAVAEAGGWQGSLNLQLVRGEGRAFYTVIATATVGGVVLCFTRMDAVKELFWSTVLNGVIAVPIMIVMMLLAAKSGIMGSHAASARLRILGWCATGVMTFTLLTMFLTL